MLSSRAFPLGCQPQVRLCIVRPGLYHNYLARPIKRDKDQFTFAEEHKQRTNGELVKLGDSVMHFTDYLTGPYLCIARSAVTTRS